MMDTSSTPAASFRNRSLAIFALIFVLCLPSLWAGMMGDDYMHYAIFNAQDLPIDKPDDLSLFGLFSFINGDPERNRQAMDLGVIPWWTYGGMKYAFWRPVSEVSHWIDHQLWPRMPSLMHLQNVLWYMGLCFLLLKLYKRTLTTPAAALLALILYGLDSTHGFAISWIANRNGIISAFFGMASFYGYIRWRESGALSWHGASLMLMLLALLSAELGISTFGYIAAYAISCDKKGKLKGILACAPHFIVIITWWMIYKSAGFGAANADAYYVDPAAQPLKFISMFFSRYPVLLASQWGIIPAEIYGYSPSQSIKFVIGCAIYLCLVLPFVIATCIKHPTLRMWMLGMFFSLVPATTALPQDRVLIFTGIGASAVIAHFLHWVFAEKLNTTFFPNWTVKTVAGLLVVLHLVLSPILLPIASYSTKIFWSNLISQTPSQFPDIHDIETKRLVIVGAPLASALAIAPFRFYRGEPIPERIWMLSSLDQDISFRKTGPADVELSLNGGFIQGAETAVRDFTRFPFSEGEQVKLSGMSITIGELNEKEMPKTLILHFDTPIEQSQLKFLRWNSVEKHYDDVQFSD